MNNEIKVGDKVRIADNVPEIYTQAIFSVHIPMDMEVKKVQDGSARITPILSGAGGLSFEYIIPTKYLIKVEDEAKEPKFHKGEKVRYKKNPSLSFIISSIMDDGMLSYWEEDYDGLKTQRLVHPDYVEPYTEPTAPTIKVGSEEWVDKQVWNYKLKQRGVIKRIANGCAEVFTQYGEHKVWSLVDLFDEYDEPFGKWKSVQPTEPTEAEKKPNIGSIKIPVEVDLTDSYWEAYTADLAKEIALKVANEYSDPKEAADYAVSVAKAVVENLKKK